MLGLRPLGGSALLSVALPEPIPDAFTAITQGRGTEFAVIFEVTGFPKYFPLESGGAHPLLGNSLLGGFGVPGEIVSPAVAPITLFLSDYRYRTKPDDLVRPNLWTEVRMTRRADVTQSAPVSQGASRRSQETAGDLEFADNDGYLRDLSDAYSFDNRPAKIHVVEISQPWTAITTISQSVVKNFTRSKGSARFNLEDASNILDTPLVTRVYGGTGLRDGSPELTDTAPPIGYGLCKYAKPLLEDPGIYLYRLSDFSINAVHAVEESGLEFTFDEDVSTYELLRLKADTLAEGEYATCLADGSILIKFAGGEPNDPDAIRVTFEGDKSGGTYVSFIGDVMLNMLQYAMGIPDSQIEAVSFDALPQHKISYYFGGGATSPTGAQAFNTIMESAFGAFGSVNDERIGVRLFYPPADQSASDMLTSNEIYSVDEVAPPQLPIWSQSMGWGPNQDPYTQEQLETGSLTASEIEERTRSFEGTYKDQSANVLASNAKAVIGSFINGVFDEEDGAIDSVQRLMGVWGVNSKTFEIETSFVAAGFVRGSVISITHDDLGAKSGEKFLIYSKRLRLAKRRVLLTVVG